VQAQTGNPLNIVTGIGTFNGVVNTLRPDLVGTLNTSKPGAHICSRASVSAGSITQIYAKTAEPRVRTIPETSAAG
jgi:hypothetical protein